MCVFVGYIWTERDISIQTWNYNLVIKNALISYEQAVPRNQNGQEEIFWMPISFGEVTSRPVFPYIENLAVGLRVIFSLDIFDNIQNQHTFFLPCPSDFSNFAHDSTSNIQVTDVAHVDRWHNQSFIVLCGVDTSTSAKRFRDLIPERPLLDPSLCVF